MMEFIGVVRNFSWRGPKHQSAEIEMLNTLRGLRMGGVSHTQPTTGFAGAL